MSHFKQIVSVKTSIRLILKKSVPPEFLRSFFTMSTTSPWRSAYSWRTLFPSFNLANFKQYHSVHSVLIGPYDSSNAKKLEVVNEQCSQRAFAFALARHSVHPPVRYCLTWKLLCMGCARTNSVSAGCWWLVDLIIGGKGREGGLDPERQSKGGKLVLWINDHWWQEGLINSFDPEVQSKGGIGLCWPSPWYDVCWVLDW